MISTWQMSAASARDWRRNEPLLLSDFIAPGRVVEKVGDIAGQHL